MNTEIAVSEPQKQAWIGLALKKNETVAELQKYELQLQGIISNVPEGKEAEQMKLYRSTLTKMIDYRKAFTSMITDKLITPLLDFEKRCAPSTNEIYKAVAAKELEDRKKAELERLRTKNIEEEKITFNAFVRKELTRMESEYRISLYNYIEDARKLSLSVDELRKHLDIINKPTINKFNAQHLTSEQLATIYNSIPKINYSAIIAEFVEAYQKPQEETIVQVSAAIEQNTHQVGIIDKIAEKQIEVINKPKVKVDVQLLATAENAELIVATFVGSWSKYLAYVKVKDIAKLTVQQMANALCDAIAVDGEMPEGLNFVEILK